MPRSKEYLVLRKSIIITLSFTSLLWVIKIVEWVTGLDFSSYGLKPGTLSGALGILTSPLIHGGGMHLLSNTLPLVILGTGLFYFYHTIALEVFLWIYFSTGVFVWLIGRDAFHIGASGLVYGFFSFLFTGGIIRRNARSLAISMAIFVLYGGMIYGIFPTDEKVSYESHMMGLLAGILLAVFFRKVPIYTGGEEGEEPLKDENDDNPPYFTDPDHSSDQNIEADYEYKPSPEKKQDK